jgi:LuxR family maltose regulon positive regulatory protein
LRLAALSLRHRGDYESLLSELTGNIQYITEYLFNELLVNQSPEIGNYMMSSSIVDRFCAPLCEALVGKDNAPVGHEINGWRFIGILRKENLFAVNLDSENYWFRFHHMFQFLLQNQLKRHRSGSDIAELHSRASKWFFENNLIEDGLRHAIAAGDTIGAVAFVEKNRQSIQNTDKWYALKNWLKLLPDSLISQRPKLLLAHAWVLLKQFKVLEIMKVMDTVDPLLADNPEETALYGEVDYFRGVCNYFFGNGAISLKHFKSALKKIPINHHDTRGHAELMYGCASQMKGEKDKAIHVLNGLLHGAQPLHNLRKIRIHLSLVFMHIVSGDLNDAIHANQRSMDVSTRNFLACEIALSNYLQGIIHFQRNELDEAIECFNQAKKERYILNTRVAIDCIAGLSLAYQLKQLPDKADTELDFLFDFVASLKDTAHKVVADFCRVRLSLMQEDLGTTIRCLKNSFSPDVAAMGFWIENQAVTRCRALIYEGSDSSLQTAEKELNEYLKMNQSHHNICQQIDILVLLALVYKKQKRDDNALDSLGQAVIYAAPGGFMRAFIEPGPQMVELLEALIQRKVEKDFIKSLLACHRSVKQTAATDAFDEDEKSLHRVSTDIQPMAAPLTNREIDILINLSKRLSNKEIAQKLFISPETVKRHTINIYRKLDTHNRQEAVTKAQALMII